MPLIAARPLATIGYEKAHFDDIVTRLKAAGVEVLVDVRAVAASRRPGFSKTLLSGGMREAGIDYMHLRDLGTPKPGREAARAGRIAEMREIFTAQLETAAAIGALEHAVEVAGKARVCLLCYEADPQCCHRLMVADRIAARTSAAIVHL